VLDLLAKQSALIRDRQLLAKEVEFLRQQIMNREEAEIMQFYSAQKTLIDGILIDVKGEEEAKIREILPDNIKDRSDSSSLSSGS